MKLRTAVILAARYEAESEIPFALLPYDGTMCLLQRTLQLLEEFAFEKIIVVTGYRAELFEPYRSERVELVKNPDYSFTASMASLAMVASLVEEDFLLIEGDTYYERKVIEDMVHGKTNNCLAITEESGSGDEAFVEITEGFVIKIAKDRHQIFRFAGEMLGIMRLSYATFTAMITAWKDSQNPLMNYEYLFMDCTNVFQRPCLFFKDIIWGDVDTYQDYENLKNKLALRLKKKENPFDHENLIAHLEGIFPEKTIRGKAQITRVGGMSNRNYKVELDEKQYVLRIPGIGSEGMVVRSHEEWNSLYACERGLNPEILYFSAETGVKLSEFVEGAETFNSATIQRSENLRAVAQILSTLHSSNVRFNNDFNVFREIENYENLLAKAKGQMYEGYDVLRSEIMSLEQHLNKIGVEITPCHNDLVAENFIKSNKGITYLIDWEYSGMNDPYWDIAALFLESDFSYESRELFLKAYFGDQVPAQAYLKIQIYQVLMDILWSIWTVVKEANGDDFGTYGKERFERGIQTLKQLKLA